MQSLLLSPTLARRSRTPKSALLGRRTRRRGVSMYLFVLILPIIFGMCGLVIDMGNLYTHRAEAQRAADAAALAGAISSMSTSNNAQTAAQASALYYANLNGYNPNDGKNMGTFVTVTFGSNSGSSTTTSDVHVHLGRYETVYFAPILEGIFHSFHADSEAARFSRMVTADATARSYVPLPLGLGGPYGISDPKVSPANTSIFGPYAYYNYGDPYATKYLQDGKTPNPQYGPQIYNLTVNSNFTSSDGKMYLQLFDPDSYSPGGTDSYDEQRPANPNIDPTKSGDTSSHPNQPTVTDYTLLQDGVPIATTEYGGTSARDKAANNTWVTPDGFNFTPVAGAHYTLKVESVSGASENGFLLRAGPQQGLALTDTQWNQQFGDQGGTNQANDAITISSSDHLQMNFTQSGTVKFYLGNIPASQAGQQIGIKHFDVDVGGTNNTITYTCDTLGGFSQAGYLPQPGDGVTYTDNVTLPTSYNGGNWYATYKASAGDTSSWQLIGKGTGNGYVRLTE